MKKKEAQSSTKNVKNLFKKIERCIDEKVRPYIEMHGGEIELIKLTPKNILHVRLHGACRGCAAANFTLQYGVQNAINEEFPGEDIKVELVE